MQIVQFMNKTNNFLATPICLFFQALCIDCSQSERSFLCVYKKMDYERQNYCYFSQEPGFKWISLSLLICFVHVQILF